jgi:hypothetical protein
MSKRILVLACAALAVLALSATAVAKLPKTSSTLIEPGKSVGGLKLAMSAKKAKAAWGKGECSGDAKNGSCQYAGSSKQGSASYGLVDGKVVDMFLSAGRTKAGKLVYSSPTAQYKTAKGIGVGSTRKAVRQAYPKIDRSYALNYVLKGKGKRYTSFSFQENRVSSLSVADGEHQG